MIFERIHGLFVGRFAELFGSPVVFHGFSLRKGGVSSPPYDSLNLGFGTDDSPDRVAENRRRFFREMGISEMRVASGRQVHGDRVVRVTGSGDHPGTDGFVTDTMGIGLVVRVADCLPVYLYDSRRRAVGLVHAGWRGTVRNIVAKAVGEMGRYFGTEPQDVWAFFGPSIGPCCYEVGPEVAGRFSAKYVRGGRLDLWQNNRDQLVGVGVQPERVVMSRLCTVCRTEWFFSHRASGGQTGRMMAVLGLREG